MKRAGKRAWYLAFRAEMIGIGCEFPTDDEIKVPIDKQDEAKAIIQKYKAPGARL